MIPGTEHVLLGLSSTGLSPPGLASSSSELKSDQCFPVICSASPPSKWAGRPAPGSTSAEQVRDACLTDRASPVGSVPRKLNRFQLGDRAILKLLSVVAKANPRCLSHLCGRDFQS